MTILTGVISYPIPAYANVPIEPQYYQPSQFFISAISLGYTTTVTTTVNHNYVIGQQIRLIIPPTFGCRQINQQTGYVIGVPAADQVVVTINSVGSDPFILSSAATQAQIVAIGDVNSGQTNSSGITSQSTFIPGSFQDISPL